MTVSPKWLRVMTLIITNPIESDRRSFHGRSVSPPTFAAASGEGLRR